MMQKKKISVVIPCYNEERVINNTIKTIVKFFKDNQDMFIYELILSDDGSTDKTLDIITRYSNNYPKIDFRWSDKNRGKGHAVREGLLKAKYNNVLVLDADLSVNIYNLLICPFLHRDKPLLIIGKRFQVKKQPLYRIIAGNGFRIIVNALFYWDYRDTQCPFKLLQNIPKEFINNLRIDGFSYDVELLYKAKDVYGYYIYENSVNYHNDENSSVTIRKTIKMFIDLLRIRFQ